MAIYSGFSTKKMVDLSIVMWQFTRGYPPKIPGGRGENASHQALGCGVTRAVAKTGKAFLGHQGFCSIEKRHHRGKRQEVDEN